MPPGGLRHKVSVSLVAEGAAKVGFPTSPASGKCAVCPDPTASPPRSRPGSLGVSLSLSVSSSVSIKLTELSYPPPRVEVLSCLCLQRQSLVFGAKTRKCLCQTRKRHRSLSPKRGLSGFTVAVVFSLLLLITWLPRRGSCVQ